MGSFERNKVKQTKKKACFGDFLNTFGYETPSNFQFQNIDMWSRLFGEGRMKAPPYLPEGEEMEEQPPSPPPKGGKDNRHENGHLLML